MKKTRWILTVATIAFGVALAAQAAKAIPLTTARSPLVISQDQNSQAPAVSMFTGTINEPGDSFTFTNDSTKSVYQLDNQQSAGKFDGKKVKVIGTLDGTNNTIRVQSIEAATA